MINLTQLSFYRKSLILTTSIYNNINNIRYS